MTGASAKPTALVGPEGLEPHSRLHASHDIASAFTPGPWELKPHAKLGDTQMYWVNGQTSVGTQVEADARLMAAAPELYEALGVCLAMAERALKSSMNLRGMSPYDIGVEALRKARGEQVQP